MSVQPTNGFQSPGQPAANNGMAGKAIDTSGMMLNNLHSLPAIEVRQKIDWLEAVANTAGGCSCCEYANTYAVYDSRAAFEEKREPNQPGHIITVQENKHGDITDICCRACCNPFHQMDLTVLDRASGEPLFHINRPFKGCGCACCPCCLQEWQVKAPDPNGPRMPNGKEDVRSNPHNIGFVTQSLFGGCLCPEFNLIVGDDPRAMPFELIRGPHCIGELCCSVMFNFVNPADKKEMRGHATKLGTKTLLEALQQCGTDADNFEMVFPKESTPQHKAVEITAMVLLDYYFFEDGGAFQCNPCGGPGEPICSIKLCTQYLCGTKQTYTCSCSHASKSEDGASGACAAGGDCPSL